MSISPLGQIFLFGGGTALASVLLTPLVRKFAVMANCVARPSQDRWGHRAIARLGGIPIALGFLAATAFSARQEPRLWYLLSGGVLMLTVGLADDFRRLHPYSKLITQIIASCLVATGNIQIATTFPWLTIPLTIGWLVLVMNAFNLMDNMDGLAGGIGVIAAVFCTWRALQEGQGLTAILSVSLAGATVGFLIYNLPPAKIYMGDTGSQVLGLGLGAISLMGTWHQPTHLLGIVALPTLLLAVPIFDTCFVAVQRMLHGRHPFQGGTDHLSHRLGILGLTTRQVVFTLYGISACLGVLSVLLAREGPIVIIGVWLLAAGIFLLGGAYLSRVRVYSGPVLPVPGPRFTLIETMLLHKRRIVEVLVDFVLICASYVIAHSLRFEANITPDLENLILQSLPWIIVVKMLCFFLCGLYRGVWRYASVTDLVNIFRAVTLGSVFSALTLLYLWRFQGYSRAVFIIDGLLLFVMVGGARITERLLNEWVSASLQDAIPVLIIGAGDSGELLLRQLKQGLKMRRRVIGFVDDDFTKQGSRIHGVPILGSRRDLGRIVKEFGICEVLIAIRQPPPDLLQQIQGYCEENGIAWRVVTAVDLNKSTSPPPV